MKKSLASIFLLFLLVSITTQAKNEITIWTSSENIKTALDNITGEFEKDFKTKVVVTVLNKDLTVQFKTAAITNKGPDILVWAHDVVGELATSGLIEPLSPPSIIKNKILDVALDAFTFRGRLYGYPYDLEAVGLIYNKKLVPHPPETMEELKKIAKEITNKEKQIYGFLYDIGNFFFTFPFFSAGGGYIFKIDNNITNVHNIGLSNAGSIKGSQYLYSLVSEGIIPSSTDYGIASNFMKKGQLGMTINGPWALGELKQANIDFGVAPLPKLDGNRLRPFVGTHGFIIRRSSKNKVLAKELIEGYLMTKQGIHSLYKADPRCPTHKDVLNDLIKDDHILNAFLENAKNGIPMPNVPEMSAIWDSMNSALKLIISGQSTSEKALNQAHKQIMASLKIDE